MTGDKMTHWILGLVVAAAIINGLLAGGNVDRALVAMPAWHHVGPVAWADFSRYADLGNGQLLYPFMALTGTLISIAAAILLFLPGHARRDEALPVFLAAALMLAALPFSFQATPFMLSIRHINNGDVAALGRAFSGFEFWGRLQGVFHVAAFCVGLWSVVSFSRPRGSIESPLISTV